MNGTPEYDIDPLPKYEKKLRKLSPKVQNQINTEVELTLRPSPYETSFPLDGKAKKAGMRKFRIGAYRIIIIIDENPRRTIHLLDIDIRDEAYKW